VEIAPFGDLNAMNFSPWGESPPEKSVGMGMEFHPPSRGDSVPEYFIKIAFICVTCRYFSFILLKKKLKFYFFPLLPLHQLAKH
jgi:hypothetical protein